MNYCDMIHETVIRDVLDMLEDLKNADAVEAINNRTQGKSFRSIAAATSNLTLVFPCVVSRVMTIENASMFSKAMERKAVSMLQMLFSALSITNAEDGMTYLKNFHTNLKLDGSLTIDKFMNMMDHLVLEGAVIVNNEEIYRKYSNDLKNLSTYLPNSVREECSLSDYLIIKHPNSLQESYILESKGKKVIPVNPDMDQTQMDYLDSIIDNDPKYAKLLQKPMSKKKAVNEGITVNGISYDEHEYSTNHTYALNVDKADKDIGMKIASFNAGRDDQAWNRASKTVDRDYNAQQDAYDSDYKERQLAHKITDDDIKNKGNADNLSLQRSKFDTDIQRDIRNYNKSLDDTKYQRDKDALNQKYIEDRDKTRDQQAADKMNLDRDRYDADIVRNRIDYLKNQLLDNDVKKPNELVPTTMIVNYITKGENGRPIQSQTVIGVKAKLYPVNSDDVLKRIAIKHVDKNFLIGLIKSTTREISFVRDFLFAIDRAKLDALSQSRKSSSSKLWKVIERRGVKSRWNRTIGSINDATAITSLAITQEEAEYLKKMEDIDVEDPRIIRPIMESYNLMCFCIIDENNEVAKFIFDTGDDIYEEMAFRSLEREDKGNDYKKIINLMSKIR